MKLDIHEDGAKINMPYDATVTGSAGNNILNVHLAYLFHLNGY